MTRRGLRRLAGRVLVVLVVVLAVGLAGLGFLLWRSVPQYNRDLAVAGVSAPIEILRSADAVPHIFGATDDDVMFGLGYAHAQDRLWQMELLRRTAQGRLAELVGPPAVRSDELLLRMGLYSAAEAAVAVQEPAALAALQAYAAGVNARIVEADGWGEAAPEFLLFPEEIAPWTPADSLAVLKLLALQLASHVDREVLRARVAQVISPERLADILPDDPNPGIAAMPRPDSAALDPGFLGAGDLRDGWSSDAWAVSPARSSTGASLLANDPHLNFSAPSPWYLVHLGLKAGDVRGGTIPGIPVVLSGQNPHLAWGITSANMDDQDVHIERPNPENPDQVLGPTGWVPLRAKDATIVVRGADPITITLQWTENGPVIPGSYYNLSKITPPGHVTSILRTLFEPADTSFSAAFKLMFAASVTDGRIATAGFVTPAQNLMLADHDNIGLQIIGAFPRRHPSHATQGRTPSEGWVAANRWDGTFPYADNPYFYNPPEGALGSTNNKSVERPFPRHVSFDWGDTQRILRLADRFRAADVHDRDSLVLMQLDAVSRPALVLLPLLLYQTPKATGSMAAALEFLSTWDGAMLAERPEPLIYTEWMRQFQIALIRDDLGPELTSQFLRANAIFLGRVLSDTNGAAVWCDDVTSAVPETCADMLALSLAAAMERLAITQGDDPGVWTWGAAHVATHDHAVLGAVPFLAGFVNIRQPSSGGDDTLLRGMTRGTGEEPLQNQHGAVYRALYDLADPDASLFLVSTGQSGNFLSSHYRDMAALWLSGSYVRLPLDRDALRADAIGVTWLRPE